MKPITITVSVLLTSAVLTACGGGGGSSGGGPSRPPSVVEEVKSPEVFATVSDAEGFGARMATGDFDNDGIDDIAIGLPFTDKNTNGVVYVFEGSVNTGPVLEQGTVWQLKNNRYDDRFGYQLASGNFNGDNYDDLAIVGMDSESGFPVGTVTVMLGSASGLRASYSQTWSLDDLELEQSVTANLIPQAIVAADFNGDGADDIALGLPEAGFGLFENAGAVAVILATPGTLRINEISLWHQDSTGIEGEVAADDYFGGQLAAADFNGDGYADLAISVVGETVIENLAGGGTDEHPQAGAVNVIYGSDQGLDEIEVPNQLWTQNSLNVDGDAAEGDGFGAALAVGDFNFDDNYDLAIGVPYDQVGDVEDAGSVTVLYGRPGAGLAVQGSAINQWHQEVVDDENPILFIPGESTAGDQFGASLIAADFNGDFVADLAIGVPGKSTEGLEDSGAVHVISGNLTSGLKVEDNQKWSQQDNRIDEVPEVGDLFGANLAAGDFNGDGVADLLIAAPQESQSLGPIGVERRVGLVHLLFGFDPDGLDDTGSLLLYQGGVVGDP